MNRLTNARNKGALSSRIKLERKNVLFDIGYVLYFISLFIPDLAIAENNPTVTIIYKMLRYVSYCLFIGNIFINQYSVRKIIFCALFVLLAFVYFTLSGDFYYAILPVILLSASKKNSRDIISLSLFLLMFCAGITAIATVIGIFSNTTNTFADNLRYELGYYHSDVFPLIVFYIMSYSMILKDGMNKSDLLFGSLATILALILCRSRNGLIGCVMLLLWGLFTWIYQVLRNKPFVMKRMPLIFRYSILILSVISILLVMNAGKGIEFIYKINLLVSGRIGIAFNQMRSTGLHLINTINGDVFFAGNLPIDSGYLLVALRYGILFLLLYMFVQYNIMKNYNQTVCIVFFVTTLTNLIDNDLLSYGFLPYILLAFNQSNSILRKQDGIINRYSSRQLNSAAYFTNRTSEVK